MDGALEVYTRGTTVIALVKVDSQKPELDKNIEDQDELAEHLLNCLSMAGGRFAEMQRREWGS